MNRIQTLLNLAQEEIAIAQLLLDNSRYRVCISRSYYAIFHAAQALLSAQNLNSRTHKGLIKLFGQYFIKTGELSTSLATALSDIYDLRKLSDYDENSIFTHNQAQAALDSATRFVEQSESWLRNKNFIT